MTILNVDGISKHKEIFCANNNFERNLWFCSFKKYLNQYCDLTQPQVTVKQPVIIIPTPSRFCNEKWNYQQNGRDWECTCKEGKIQSPIDLPAIEKPQEVLNAERTLFEFNKIETENNKELKFVFEDYKITIYGNFGKLVTPDLIKYTAEKIEFHTGAEHQINSKNYDLEAQIYYSSVKYPFKKAILSFLFEMEAGSKNKFFDFDIDILDLPSSQETQKTLKPGKISLMDLFVYSSEADKLGSNNHTNKFLNGFLENKIINSSYFNTKETFSKTNIIDFNYYSYVGSFTSPPCEEEILWFIGEKPLPIGFTTLEYFKDSLKISELSLEDNCVDTIELTDSKRNIMPKNNRQIYYYNSELQISCDNKGNLKQEKQNTKKETEKHEGHFEKVQDVITKYYYVNSDETTGVPGAINVSPQEAGAISYTKNKIKIFT